MVEESSPAWSALPDGTGDDFSNFLDFEGVEINFAEDSVDSITNMSKDPIYVMPNDFSHDVDVAQASGTASPSYPASESLADVDMNGQLFHQHSQMINNTSNGALDFVPSQTHKNSQCEYYRRGAVPPTPNSAELHGASMNAYTDHQMLGMYESGNQQEQMIFTPLVSPAFQIQDCSTLSEYFSPLTSPALQPQDMGMSSAVISHPNGADRRDFQVSNSSSKKTKRRSTTGGKDPVHIVRSSPAMKAKQKNKAGNGKTSREVAEIISELGNLKQTSAGLDSSGRNLHLNSQATSDNGSVSPEPLSDVLMPPPALPKPNNSIRSTAQDPHETQPGGPGYHIPATPASLFRVAKGDEHMPGKSSALDGPEEVVTQIAARSLDSQAVQLTQSKENADLSDGEFDHSTDKLPMTIASTGFAFKNGQTSNQAKGQAAQVRVVKKKKDGTTTQASPALRPRISPSIKPLLRGGTLYDSEATATLLANKSNYERIIDGSASQLGVAFPAQLSENLTSKKTSHKLAEQGRRHRINTGLAEIQALLPANFGSDNDGAGESNLTANASGASKAKTVENAITYIKHLTTELAEVKAELAKIKAPEALNKGEPKDPFT